MIKNFEKKFYLSLFFIFTLLTLITHTSLWSFGFMSGLGLAGWILLSDDGMRTISVDKLAESAESAESKMTYVEELIKLMQENPELEVLCKVDSDIVADDGYAWWLGQINDRCGIEIDEYTCIQERIVFKSEEDWTEWFEDLFDVDDYMDIPDEEWDEFCEKKINETVTWTKAIFVSVTTL